jgi:Type ISP C-terminal specificity domain
MYEGQRGSWEGFCLNVQNPSPVTLSLSKGDNSSHPEPDVARSSVSSRAKSRDEVRQDNDNIGKVWINSTQYFDKVPQVAWDFYIGGYQPAHKWLKDRKGRTLNFDDIQHYQKIIVALSETDRLMKEIEKISI